MKGYDLAAKNESAVYESLLGKAQIKRLFLNEKIIGITIIIL